MFSRFLNLSILAVPALNHSPPKSFVHSFQNVLANVLQSRQNLSIFEIKLGLCREASSKFKCRFEPRKNKIPLQDFYMSYKRCLQLSGTFLALLLVYFTRTTQLTISKWMISSSVAIQGFSPLMPYKIKRLLLQEY